MNLKNIVRTFTVSSLLFCALTPASAQDLLARQAPVDRRTSSLDTIAINRLREVEDIKEPAAELYNDWNNRYAHRPGVVPDVYKIDLRGFSMPTPSRVITSNFGRRWGRRHQGLDIKVYIGDTIRAAFSGKVRMVKYDANGYGKYIVIRHNNGLETIYGHLSKQLIHENQIVRSGQAIGLGGNTGRSTGSHLHFETRLCGVALNPALFFDFPNQDVTGDYYVYRKNNIDSESARATALRGTAASLGYSRENIQGKRTTTPAQKSAEVKQAPAAADYSNRESRTTPSNTSAQILYHKVVADDTLESIAQQYGITVEQLCKLNHLGKYSKVVKGQIIRYS